MFRTSVCVCVLFLLACCVLPMAAQQGQPQVTTYYGCVNNSTGAIRIVSKTTVCKSTEHKINWNQAGPQGPQGAQGPQGPQGPPGMSVGYFTANTGGFSMAPASVAVQTDPIQTTGFYYINATALFYVDTGDLGACYVTLASNGNFDGLQGASSVSAYQTVSIADARVVSAGDSIQLTCYSLGGDSHTVGTNASLTATLMNSSLNASKSKHSQHAGSANLAPK
jgi:hypothetical protein